MDNLADKLKTRASSSRSKWHEDANFRLENKRWLRYSQTIAIKMLDRMDQLGLSQSVLAERMGCSQQYVSKILKGRENLSLETISKIETALDLRLFDSKLGEGKVYSMEEI